MSDKKARTTIRLTNKQEEELKHIKEKHGASIAFLVRRGVNWVIARYKEQERKENENNLPKS